jgi:hypothetical protein
MSTKKDNDGSIARSKQFAKALRAMHAAQTALDSAIVALEGQPDFDQVIKLENAVRAARVRAK